MIAIVGGGISGLATGLELTRRGADFIVLEASGRAGGVIRSGEVDGRVVDWGPQRTRLTRRMQALIRELDLEQRVLTAAPDLDLYVYRGGRLRVVPFSFADFLTSDIISIAGKLRFLMEPLTSGADSGERVAQYFSRKVGREVYEVLVAPLYGGLYASDPADMEVGLSLIPLLRQLGVSRSLLVPLLRRGGKVEPPPACTFEGGMEELPRAIATKLGRRLRLRTPVESIRRSGGGWRIDAGGEGIDAGAIVVCTPAPAARDLLIDVAPGAAAAIGGLNYNPLAIVHLAAGTELRGLGFQVAFTEPDLALRGVTFNDSLFGRRDLYTAYLGGARHPQVARMGADELGRLAAREFAACTGYAAEVLSVERAVMPAWDTSWAALRGLELPRGVHVASSWWSRPGLAGRFAEASSVASALVAPRTSAEAA